MHTIKFRGKSLSTGEWVYGSYLEVEVQGVKHARIIPIFDQKEEVLDGTIDIDCIAVDPKTVGQYIGLNDKDGQEIYEGDKLQIGELTTFLVPKIMYLSVLHEYIKRRIWVKVIHDNPTLLTQ